MHNVTQHASIAAYIPHTKVKNGFGFEEENFGLELQPAFLLVHVWKNKGIIPVWVDLLTVLWISTQSMETMWMVLVSHMEIHGTISC
jgi:hypothetical protein